MGARHPKGYKQGPAKPVTVPWKLRVLAKLKQNEKEGKTPAKREQLNDAIGAPKGYINKLLDVEREPMHWTTKYLDEITEAIGVAPPLLEDEDDDESFWSDVQLLRSLSTKARNALRGIMDGMEKK